jgi:hypothetical protein
MPTALPDLVILVVPPSNAGLSLFVIMEQTQLPSNPAQVTKALAKASFSMEAARLNYQVVLQSIEDIQWTRENIDQDLLAPAKEVAAKLTEKKDKDKRPFIDAGKVIQTEYNDLFNPINDAISRKANERKKLADDLQKEADNAARENERISGINSAIVSFISNMSNEITLAQTDKQIASLEMRIGSEMNRKNIYNEFLPTLKEQCDSLKPLIKKQKEYVRTLAELEKQQGAAIATGNEEKAVELQEKAEALKEVVEENKLRIQEEAYKQAGNTGIVVGEPTVMAPKATRTTWKWRVDNVKELYKKQPDLVDLIPNKEKIDEILRQKREDGSLDGKREETINGIVFYEDKSYK